MQDGGLDDGNGSALIEYTIVKSGNVYTITDPDGATVFQGKQKAHEIRSSRLKKNIQNHQFSLVVFFISLHHGKRKPNFWNKSHY